MKNTVLLALLFAAGIANATNAPIYSVTPTVVHKPTNTVNNATNIKPKNTNTQQQSQKTNSVSATGPIKVKSPSASSSNATTADSNNASQTVVSTVPRQVASAANVAIMPTTVCAGTTGAGAQGASFGISFGTSWTDQNCMLLEQIRAVVLVLGETEVAAEMLCNIDAYRDARERLGQPCAVRPSSTGTVTSSPDLTDPHIRRRLGLAPLN